MINNFNMIDIGRKRPTRRIAVACGSIYMNGEAFNAVKNGTLPKGNALTLAEVAGITGAKKTSDLIPMCHNLSLEQVTIHYDINEKDSSIIVYAQVAAFAKTGVEMEALNAVNTALLTIWDLTKSIDPNLKIDSIRLLTKTGGKSGVWINANGIPDWLQKQLPSTSFLNGKSSSILVMSDRASKGEYIDESGTCLRSLLTNSGSEIKSYDVVPDDADKIEQTILNICKKYKPDLIIASGGTGPGPRDVTPDVLIKISDRMLDGLGDVLRFESLYYTDTAWLSRMTAGMVGSTLVIAFPGSPKAVKECWEILSPFLGDALNKIKKQGFEELK